MLIECLIKRDGPTIVSVEKMDYVFTSRPHLSGGDEVAQICEVNSKSHSEYLLRVPGGLYRKYSKKGASAPATHPAGPPARPVVAPAPKPRPNPPKGNKTSVKKTAPAKKSAPVQAESKPEIKSLADVLIDKLEA